MSSPPVVLTTDRASQPPVEGPATLVPLHERLRQATAAQGRTVRRRGQQPEDLASAPLPWLPLQHQSLLRQAGAAVSETAREAGVAAKFGCLHAGEWNAPGSAAVAELPELPSPWQSLQWPSLQWPYQVDTYVSGAPAELVHAKLFEQFNAEDENASSSTGRKEPMASTHVRSGNRVSGDAQAGRVDAVFESSVPADSGQSDTDAPVTRAKSNTSQSEAATQADASLPMAGPLQAPPRLAAGVREPAASAPPQQASGTQWLEYQRASAAPDAARAHCTTITYPFVSLGAGHQVTATWVRAAEVLSSGYLYGSSERSHAAVSAAIAAGGAPGEARWQVEPMGSGHEDEGRGHARHQQDEPEG